MNHEETIDVSLHLKKLYEAIRRLTRPLTSSQGAEQLYNALKGTERHSGPLTLPLKVFKRILKQLYTPSSRPQTGLQDSFLQNLIDPNQKDTLLPQSCHRPSVPDDSKLQGAPRIIVRQRKLQPAHYLPRKSFHPHGCVLLAPRPAQHLCISCIFATIPNARMSNAQNPLHHTHQCLRQCNVSHSSQHHLLQVMLLHASHGNVPTQHLDRLPEVSAMFKQLPRNTRLTHTTRTCHA